ncbi:kynurenine formamidase [Paenibacillus forsythiae]|uniref:Kynurenine formamidase n=1 Tax=Paenibacillus forsythiae TaxID=365616 RepID=A0ABU3H9V6_9BACL|nr:cyclase family protein [Paenibacillus forsythiae]MDT3427604.1 kynurenine formamidase [Paenibacillus forsythiae]
MLIDLTHPIRDGLPVYPGDPSTKLARSAEFSRDGYNNHLLTVNMHAGTHIDGHMHMTDCTEYINEYPLDVFIGEGCLLDARSCEAVRNKPEYEQAVSEGQIVLVHTGHGARFEEPDYYTDYPALTLEFAEMLVRKKIKMIGVDTPSVDKYPFDVHHLLFKHKIPIIENLANLHLLRGAPRFEITALPLNIRADSSIARVIAKIFET